MNLQFDKDLLNHIATRYKSPSQQARVLTESWLEQNGYCPNCGNLSLKDFANNRPVADFYCLSCDEEFELKSKRGKLPTIINDGAYHTMIQRINEANNPNLFFMNYTCDGLVTNFMVVSKHFFVEDIIIKRKPLSATARRAGWVGCNINMAKVPQAGKIFMVQNGLVTEPSKVLAAFKQSHALSDISLTAKPWLLEILSYIDRLNAPQFNLSQLYAFIPELQAKFPDNHHIQAKIRQQLQILRDKGFIEFLGRGRYRKID